MLHRLDGLREAVKRELVEVVLASQSPRRKDIFDVILPRLPYSIIPSTFEEDLDKVKFPTAEGYVLETSRRKAEEVFERLKLNREGLPKHLVVIGCDTVVVRDDTILEKPPTHEAAKLMLRSLSGRSHRVLSGVSVLSTLSTNPCNGSIDASAIQTDACSSFENFGFVEATHVTFSELDDDLIDEYVASGEPMDKAGGYGYQGTARCFVERIEGDYWNVVGFPSCAFAKRASPLLVEIARRAMEEQA